jgi:hypothetical protein
MLLYEIFVIMQLQVDLWVILEYYTASLHQVTCSLILHNYIIGTHSIGHPAYVTDELVWGKNGNCT